MEFLGWLIGFMLLGFGFLCVFGMLLLLRLIYRKGSR